MSTNIIPSISVVTTMYKSDEFLNEFYQRTIKSVKEITNNYEIIMINDGCPNNSFDIAKKIANKDQNVKIINLSCNFGHHKAIMTGLSYAIGGYIFLIDCDLEEQPEDLNKFWDKINEEKSDVVVSVLQNRKGGFFEKYIDGLFYTVFNFLSDKKIPKNTSTITLMKRNYVDALLLYKEQNLFFHGLRSLAGFKQSIIKIIKHSRSGNRTYTLTKRIKLFINCITSFSSRPLYYIFVLGIIISFTSIIFGGYLFYRKIFYSYALSGWTSLMVSIWFIGGIITLCLGIIAIYLAKIFIEVKNRPYTIVESIYSKKR